MRVDLARVEAALGRNRAQPGDGAPVGEDLVRVRLRVGARIAVRAAVRRRLRLRLGLRPRPRPRPRARLSWGRPSRWRSLCIWSPMGWSRPPRRACC